MKIIRTSTIPSSLNNFCRDLLRELREGGYEVVVVSSPGEELVEVGVREGVMTYPIPMERHISPFRDLKSLWGLIKVFRKERPDIVHSITPKAGLLSMIAAKVTGVPVRVHMFTGLVFPTSKGIKRKILILTDKLTCLCATHIIPEGEGVKRDLQNFKITKKPMRVLGHGNIHGIDLKYFDPELPEIEIEAKKIRKDGIYTFIFIGRLVGDKGINELIEAFERLNNEIPNTRLLLVGPTEQNLDPLKPETISKISNNNSMESVGSQGDVRPWLLASDAFVFPSYREGFPNVVIEAGAMGLPSIVTDINGSREIIIEGKNGIIIPPKDVDSLYEAMKKFVSQREETKKMADSSRSLIASRYERNYVHQCLKDFYKEILPTE